MPLGKRRAKIVQALIDTKTELVVAQPESFCHVFGHLTPDAAGRLADAVIAALAPAAKAKS